MNVLEIIVVVAVGLVVGALLATVTMRNRRSPGSDAHSPEAALSPRKHEAATGSSIQFLGDVAGMPLIEVETLVWPAQTPFPPTAPIPASAPIAALIHDLIKSAGAEGVDTLGPGANSQEKVYRFVARPELLAGLNDGTLERLPQFGGLGDTIRDASTKKFVGKGSYQLVQDLAPAALAASGPPTVLLAAVGLLAVAIVEAERAIRTDIQQLQESVDQLKLDALSDDVAEAKNASNAMQATVAVLLSGGAPLHTLGLDAAAAHVGRGFELADGWVTSWETALASPQSLADPKTFVRRFPGLDRRGGETDVKVGLVSAWCALYRQRAAAQLAEAVHRNPTAGWAPFRDHLRREVQRANDLDDRLAAVLEGLADLELEVKEGFLGSNNELSTGLRIQKRATQAARTLRTRPISSNDVIGRNALGQIEMRVLARANGELHVLPPASASDVNMVR